MEISKIVSRLSRETNCTFLKQEAVNDRKESTMKFEEESVKEYINQTEM